MDDDWFERLDNALREVSALRDEAEHNMKITIVDDDLCHAFDYLSEAYGHMHAWGVI